MQNDRADSNAYNLFPGGDLEKWGENLPALVEINVPDKGLIYREGDRYTKVFCIIKGVVKLSVITEQGNELTTALLRRGEIFGSLQPESLQETKQTAQAVGEVRAYQINRDEFKALLSQQPHLSWCFIEALCAQRQQAERKLQNVLTQTVEMRVLGTLKELSEMCARICFGDPLDPAGSRRLSACQPLGREHCYERAQTPPYAGLHARPDLH